MNASRVPRLAPSLLWLLALPAGCGEQARTEGTASWQVDTAVVLEIGALEGDAVHQLYRVRGIAELPDGAIALANAGSSEVRLYDASGRFVRALGRAGEGPGEFTMVLNVVVRGDTIYAYDRMAGLLTRFLRSGAFLGDDPVRANATLMTPDFAGLLRDGTPVGSVEQLAGGSVDGFQRSSAALVRFTGEGRVDTLGVFPADETVIHRRYLGGGAVAAAMYSWSYCRAFLAVAGGERIYAAPTDSAVVHAWDGAGAPLRDIRWDDAPRPLDDATAAALVARETENLRPADRDRERREARAAPHPPTAPVFDKLLLGPEEELWVRRFDQPGTRTSEWLVFDAAGLLRARVRLPREREIRAVGRERIYTIERDEYDVEYVRGYRLRR